MSDPKKCELSDLQGDVQALIEKFGLEQVEREVVRNREAEPGVSSLIILPNRSIHPPLGFGIQGGEVFAASTGQLDFSSAETAKKCFVDAITAVRTKLYQRRWAQVFLAPFGPAILVAQIKLAVYRILHVDTIDLLYVDGRYLPIEIDQRVVLAAEGNT